MKNKIQKTFSQTVNQNDEVKNKYDYLKIAILFDTQHLSEGLTMEFNA